ncbi:MAG TPA: LuxR C-terminal-related transcriptional regulator [Gammaproteobacteria bacterium]
MAPAPRACEHSRVMAVVFSAARHAGGAGFVARPALFELLQGAARVTVVSAPAGSGKTSVLRAWVAEAGLTERVAWVSVPRAQHDAQQFWARIVDALRKTTPGAALVRVLTPAPSFDGWALVERLLEDLSASAEPLWLVLDDLHEVRSDETLRQLELLLLRAPDTMRFVLSTRHDLRLGLHRLRLEGELTEIRRDDLRFTLEEARALMAGCGVALSDAALERLVAKTEGWAAGLRLAALSLVRHADPERFAADFSGSERTVAEYLLAEVLDRQPDDVRRLLLRTSILDRVSGPLADLLTGGSGGERILQQLEDANAFVVAIDPGRTWFRYHHLFADFLRVELRRTAPNELARLHSTAATWYASHGQPIEAVRHAQAADDWDRAARLLSDHWFELVLDGHAATAHDLLSRFPPGIVAANAELIALTAAGELNRGSLEEAERHLLLATQEAASVPEERRKRFEVILAALRLSLARQRSDLPAAIEEAQRVLAPPPTPAAAPLGLGEDLRALALISLGAAEFNALRIDEAKQHLEQGIALARRIERPFLELNGLAHLAAAENFRSLALGVERAREAIELARRHGWTDEPVVALAYEALAGPMVWRGRLEEAETLLARAERVLRPEVEPAVAMFHHQSRGLLELLRGRRKEALRAFEAAERLRTSLGQGQMWPTMIAALELPIRAWLGETERVAQAFAQLDERARDDAQMRVALAWVHLLEGDARAATAALAPVLDGSVPVVNMAWDGLHAFLLEALARERLGDSAGAGRALEQALHLAEPDGMLWPFLLHPVSALLERQQRSGTAHAALVAHILDLRAAAKAARRGGPGHPHEPLTESEIRVLRYLPTNLSLREIAGELGVSTNTVKTHVRHLYAKLNAHGRSEAVGRARALALLAPSGYTLANAGKRAAGGVAPPRAPRAEPRRQRSLTRIG